MSHAGTAALEERVLVVAATARDAELTRALLHEAGMVCSVCGSTEELCSEFPRGAAAMLVAEEALAGAGFGLLAQALLQQPVWSDISVLLLTGRSVDSAIASRAMDTLPNVTVLERPVRILTLVSTLRTSLKSRQRQYAMRDQMQAMRESESFNRTLLAASLTGLYVYDVDAGRDVYINPQYTKLTGYTQADLDAMEPARFLELFHPEDRNRLRAHLEQMAAGESGREYEIECRVKRVDGQWIWCLARDTPLPSTDGRRRILGTFLDVTRRKQAEQEVMRLLQRLSQLVDHTPLAVVEWDANFIVTRWSGQAEKVFGWSAAEVIGRRIDDVPLVYEDDAPTVQGVMARLLDPSNSFVVSQNRNRTRSGEVISCEWYNSVLHDESGRMQAVLSMVLDVTAREQAVEALKEADRRKDEFLAVLGHELRNPLTPIRTGLELLWRAGDDKAIAEEARRMMERQVRHMTRLIDDLVDVARITRGALTLRKERADVADIVKNAVEASRPAIEAGRHELALSLPEDALIVHGDPVRLTQVAVNLLNNAARYTPAGGAIAVGAAREGAEAVITVADNGIGIPQEMLEHIFELFTQVESGSNRAYGGLGIGLALARSLVQLHGGSIRAESRGRATGSVFTVRLPLQPSAAPADRARRAEAGPTRPLRILLVDDDHDVAAATGRLLKLMGHEAAVALDAASALEAAGAPPPDLVLLDIAMPGMDGYALASALRAREGYAAVPIVAMSGFGRDVDLRHSEEAGFAAHLVKPVEPDALERLLASITT